MNGPPDEQAGVLRGAFNPSATRHIRLTRLDGSANKSVVTRSHAPSHHDYLAHLHESSRAGPGALGLSPTLEASPVGRSPRRLAAFAALDIDAATPRVVQGVVEALAEVGVMVYVTSGTSGRGAHVYAFFEEPVPTGVARAFVLNIAWWFTRAGHRVDKTFPSTANGDGMAILLPYRAAAKDEYGVNPLLVAGGDCPIPLTALRYITRLPVSVVERIAAECVDRGTKADQRGRTAATGDPVFRVAREEERLAALWRDGRRTRLTLGFSGAAAMAGVPMDVAIKAIERLERSGPDSPRVSKRLDIVERTYARQAAGQQIAFARFYEEAGVVAPALRPQHAQVHALLARVAWRRADGLGRSAPSARRILHALWSLAARFGRVTDAGVSVAVSRRQLAELSGIAVSTVNAKIPMLAAIGVLRIAKAERQRPGDAARVELLVGTNSDQSPQAPVHGLGGQTEWSEIVQSRLFTRAGLGPTPGVVAATLAERGPMDRNALAAATGRAKKTIDRALHRLAGHGLVEQGPNGAYALAHDAASRIPGIEARIGVNARLEQRARRIREERDAWLRALAQHSRPGRMRWAPRNDNDATDAPPELAITPSGMMGGPQVAMAGATSERAGFDHRARAPPPRPTGCPMSRTRAHTRRCSTGPPPTIPKENHHGTQTETPSQR